MKALRIGISLGLRQVGESMWTNGIKQNVIFLAKVLKASPAGHEVILLNTTDVDLTQGLPWDGNEYTTRGFQKFVDDGEPLDVFIEMGGQISVANMLKLKEKGCKTVSYCCGVEYLYLIEKMVGGVECWPQGLLVNRNFDAIWCIPQVAEHSAPFLETLRRAPAVTVPFVWDPMFIEQRTKDFPQRPLYAPSGKTAKRITIMEPNMNVVKTAIFPIMIAEKVYRKHPDLIDFLYVCSGKRWADGNKDFNQLMNHMDIVHGHKATFLDRYDTPQFLSIHTDVVVSHQLLNPLNYFYFDVAYLGYPLVHNAPMCEALGFYYQNTDVNAAATELEFVIRNFDDAYVTYRHDQRELLARYTSQNPLLVAKYDQLLEDLIEGRQVIAYGPDGEAADELMLAELPA